MVGCRVRLAGLIEDNQMLNDEKIRILEAVYEDVKDKRKHQIEQKLPTALQTTFDLAAVAKSLEMDCDILRGKLCTLHEDHKGVFVSTVSGITETYVPRLWEAIGELKRISNEVYANYQDAFRKLPKEQQRELLRLPFLQCKDLDGNIEWERVPPRRMDAVATVELSITSNRTALQTIRAARATRHVAIATWILAVATIVLVILQIARSGRAFEPTQDTGELKSQTVDRQQDTSGGG